MPLAMYGRWAGLALPARRAASGVASSSCCQATEQLRCMAVGTRASGGGGGGGSKKDGMSDTLKWKWLKSQGAEVNPCNSAQHPSVMAGMPPSGDEVSVQQAYNASSSCFGCGASPGPCCQLLPAQHSRPEASRASCMMLFVTGIPPSRPPIRHHHGRHCMMAAGA